MSAPLKAYYRGRPVPAPPPEKPDVHDESERLAAGAMDDVAAFNDGFDLAEGGDPYPEAGYDQIESVQMGWLWYHKDDLLACAGAAGQ